MRHWAFAVLIGVIGYTGSAPFAMADGPNMEAVRDGGDDHFDRGQDDGHALPNATCTGVLNGYFDNVVVPVGVSCTLNLATIEHDVTVSKGASLSIIGQSAPTPAIAVTIGGNLNAKGCTQVVLDGSLGGIAVRHNVDIEGCGKQSGFVGPGIVIGGDFICSNNAVPCLADQGTVVGSVVIRNNSSSTASDVSGNIIGGDLSCSSNSPAPADAGGANYVGGTARGQCGATFVSNVAPPRCSTALNLAQTPDTSIFYVQDVAASGSTPEYCQVVGAIETHGDGGQGSAGFLLRLPQQWNNRFVFMGCGGPCGSIGTLDFQTGIVTPSLSVNAVDSAEALGLGYAVVNTDTGHEPIAGSNLQPWALLDVGVPNKPALYDNLYRAVHHVTLPAKQLVEEYYNGGISYAYFDGCSTGGRQGMVEATKYPEDYDGVISGAPVFDADSISAWNDKAFAVWLAPGAFISSATIANLDAAVLANCDALDGVKDGLIQNPQLCTLDPNSLAGTVLTQPQATAVRNYISQVFDTKGRNVYPGTPLGHWSTTGVFGYINFQDAPAPHPTSPQPWSATGAQVTSGSVVGPALFTLGDPGIRYQKEQDPNFDTINEWPEGANIGQPANVISADMLELMKKRVGRGNGDDPRKLKTFLHQNRKLIMYHGFADHLATPYRTIWYYRELADQEGGYSKLQNNVRLFMVPGMGHCGGGSSPNSFDTLQTLANWVENGIAPDSLPAANTSSGASMPLCQFPEQATYVGGSPNSASSWKCDSNDHRLLSTPGLDGLIAGMDHNDGLPGH
jgi:feruloyl esterase